jgi:hypothetical protein
MLVREVPEAVPLCRHLSVEGNTAVDAVFPADADMAASALVSRNEMGELTRYSHFVREAATHRWDWRVQGEREAASVSDYVAQKVARYPYSLEIYADAVLDSVSASLDRLGGDQVEPPQLVVLAIESPRIERWAGPLLELVKGAGYGHGHGVIPTIQIACMRASRERSSYGLILGPRWIERTVAR